MLGPLQPKAMTATRLGHAEQNNGRNFATVVSDTAQLRIPPGKLRTARDGVRTRCEGGGFEMLQT